MKTAGASRSWARPLQLSAAALLILMVTSGASIAQDSSTPEPAARSTLIEIPPAGMPTPAAAVSADKSSATAATKSVAGTERGASAVSKRKTTEAGASASDTSMIVVGPGTYPGGEAANKSEEPDSAENQTDDTSFDPSTGQRGDVTDIPSYTHHLQSQSEPASTGDGATNSTDQDYQGPIVEPQLHSLQEFMAESEGSSPIGVLVEQTRRRLDSGEKADGLLIVSVAKGSPAAKAGLHAYSDTTHGVLEALTVGASLFFPPAIFALPIVESMPIGESYDMIIGVDGWRVSNMVDFEDRMRSIQPGEIVYLSVVRNGKRMQVPVSIPTDFASASY